MLFVPLAALAIFFSFVDTFFSLTAAGDEIVSIFAIEKSSSDLTRFNVLCSNSINDFRLPAIAALTFSKPRCSDSFSHNSNVM